MLAGGAEAGTTCPIPGNEKGRATSFSAGFPAFGLIAAADDSSSEKTRLNGMQIDLVSRVSFAE